MPINPYSMLARDARALRGSIRKFDDLSRELVKVARHLERRGREQLADSQPTES